MRGAFDIMARGYDGATDSTFRTHHAFYTSPEGDEDTILGAHDRDRLLLEGRSMVRNNPIVYGLLERVVSYAVFGGIWPQARTSDPKWNKLSESWWRDIYAPTCDYRQQQGVGMDTFQSMTLSERFVAGELGFIMLKNGQLQPIEASRISTPHDYRKDENVIDGVRKTKQGLILGYYVCPRGKSGAIDVKKYKYIRRENFIHCWRPTRPDMVRGIPDLAPLINLFRDYKETDQNIRAKIKNDAQTWGKSKRAAGSVNYRSRDSYTIDDANDKNLQRVEKVEGLRLLHMRPEEDVDSFESKTPNSEYIKYVEHLLHVMAQAFDLPYEFMMLIFTQGSYSAQRAAMIHAHHTILKWIKWQNKVFNQRVWNWRIAKAMKDGTLPEAPKVDGVSEWYRVEWTQPYWQEIDTDKQAKGDAAAWKMGKDSLKSIIGRTGRDRDDVFREKAEDIKAAQRIAEEEGLDDWQQLIDVSQPGDTKKAFVGGAQ
jgi:capsid protein